MDIQLNRRSALLGAAAIAVLGRASPALAHRLTSTTTHVDINSATGLVEVIHSFHVHDTETALATEGHIDSPNLSALKERAQLALYTQETFALYQNGTVVPLEVVGAELDRGNVLAYQQGKLTLPVGKLSIKAEMMRKFVPNRINNVDVVVDGKVISLQFRGVDGIKKVLA